MKVPLYSRRAYLYGFRYLVSKLLVAEMFYFSKHCFFFNLSFNYNILFFESYSHGTKLVNIFFKNLVKIPLLFKAEVANRWSYTSASPHASAGMSWGDIDLRLGLDVKFTADLHWLLSMRALAHGISWCSAN
jgi:hypothetical protein